MKTHWSYNLKLTFDLDRLSDAGWDELCMGLADFDRTLEDIVNEGLIEYLPKNFPWVITVNVREQHE